MKKWVAVVGPTGSGKSALAMELALRLGGEIVGCDSVQLYRGFDLGSAKPSVAERAIVPHHLFDVFAWNEECDAALYASLARQAIADISSRGRLPIVAGGTGLYLRALLGGGWNEDLPKDDALRKELQIIDSAVLYDRLKILDPVRARALHPNDRFRVIRALELVTLLGRPLHEAGLDASSPSDDSAFIVVLDPPRTDLHGRIERRTSHMVDAGLIDEVKGLLSMGVGPTCKPMRSIGYKEAVAVITGAVPEEGLIEAINVATRQYAKRQCTWFRKVTADLRIQSIDPANVMASLKEALT
jgi:tRNA dimethylallyltransferase